MQPQDIRLRLAIRRHGVPEIKLVWPCSCSEDLTVARLLEQVNEVVPLESGEWGLEDYAVELADGKGGSFECLHFQQVGRIFKDEDQILIRSLLTGDLKRRRLSGRHQISEDGRHLVDGLAFGRPWLRTPRDRPQIELPPRKRARIAYNPEDEEEVEEERKQLLLEAADSSPSVDDRSVRFMARFDDEDGDSEEFGDNEYHSESGSSDMYNSLDESRSDGDDSIDREADESEGDDSGEDDENLDEELRFLRRDAGADTHSGGEEMDEESEVGEDDELEEEEEYDDDDDDEDDEKLRHLKQEDVSVEINQGCAELKHVDASEDESEYSDSGADSSSDSGSDSDSDQVPAENLVPWDNPPLDVELRYMTWENAAIDEDPVVGGLIPLYDDEPSEASKAPEASDEAGHIDFSSLDLLTALWSAFPSASIRAVELELIRANKDLRQAYTSLAALHDSAMSFDEMMDQAITSLPAFFARPTSRSSEASFAGFDEPLGALMGGVERSGKVKRPLIQEVESIEEPVANDFDKSPSLTRKRNQSTIVDATADSEESDTSSSGSESDDDELDSEDDSSSESDSDDGSSSGEEDSQAEDQVVETRALQGEPEGSSSDTSSSYDSDTSESDSGSDDEDNGAPVDELADSSDSSSDSDSSDESDSESDSDTGETPSKPPVRSVASPAAAQTSSKPPVGPGNGSSRTQKRNARRRRTKMLKKLQSVQTESASENEAGVPSDELLARKQALLASIVNDNTVVADESRMQIDENPTEGNQQTEESPAEAAGDNSSEDEMQIEEPLPADAPEGESPASKDEPSQRRNRFDLGAGRRLLFGALGLRAPKSKADEEKIRQNLMKDVRPLNNPRVAQTDAEPAHGDENNTEAAAEDEDPDSWRDKITYRAVECCYENMVLSEPPFPFVQRWDPQQKYESMRKRKRASENFQAETSFAGDESYYYEDEVQVEQEAGRKKKKKRKGKSAGHVDEKMNGVNADIVLNYDDTPAKSSQFTDTDDLPSLPNDPSTLPILEPGTAKIGMVITWKQLLMSKATKWQPEVVSMTGLVLSGSDDSTLHVVLAKRDREQNDKLYDENTGQRVYEKFEAPDLDEADEEEDTGFRELQWGEMIEPRLLQPEPTTGMLGTPMQANGTTLENRKVEEEEHAEAEVSDFQTLEECLANQLNTEQVKAAVEEDMMQAGPKDTQENPESVSIQSGQQMPRLDLSVSGDEIQVSTASDSWDMLRQKNSDLSKTLEALSERGSVGVVSSEKSQPQDLQEGGETTADQEAELGSRIADVADGDVSDSDNSVSKSAHSTSDYELPDSDIDEPMADDSNLIVPSSQISIGSGRQPQVNYNSEGSPEDDGVIPETLPQLRETTPISNDVKHQGTPSNSSSPFPSIEEIYMTARQTQTSAKKMEMSALSERKPKPMRDLEYEEAMRKLDEGNESEHSPTKDERPGGLFPNATQPPPSVKFAKKEPLIAEECFAKSTGKKSEKSPFVIPAGSQVIVLSSSSPSSPAQEDDDDDVENVDETVAGRRSILPTGPGWAKKNHGNDVPRSRTKSMPALTAGTRRARREETSPSPAPPVSAVSKYKGRRSLRHSSWRR